ncbi:unnamed protein product [Callosobruchus maculatus]|uniref:Uncharacterized protein n=1 Tax=Callosobruchus maculatus TaxID=64391 RepID=A0A653BXI0_CALMS|nr:unnamed protein product [Callosobruchus maculatus]
MTNSTAAMASAYQDQAIAMAELIAGTVSMKLIALEVTAGVGRTNSLVPTTNSAYRLRNDAISYTTAPICLTNETVPASRQIFTATTVSVSRILKGATVSGIARMALTNSNAQNALRER